VAMDVLGYDLTADQRLAIEKEVERRQVVQEQIASAEAGGGSTPGNTPGAVISQSAPAGTDPTPDPSPSATAPIERGNGEVRSALFNWKAAALKAVKTGHDLKELDFDHPAIPEEAAVNIRAALRTCKCAADVQAVFGKAREWMTPPQPLPIFKSENGEGQMLAELKRANDLLEMSLQEETC